MTEGMVLKEREFFTDKLLVRIHFIIVMIRWTGLAHGSLNSLFPVALHVPSYYTQIPQSSLPNPHPTTHKQVMTEGTGGGVGAGWDTARAQQLLAELQR